jgi:hypothetical protein
MSRRTIVVVTLAASMVFGGADQYLGSFSAHPWASDVSLLSAPWLVLAFLAGGTRASRDARRSSGSRAPSPRCSATA